MAIQDCTRFLGKRVTYELDWSKLGYPDKVTRVTRVTGVIIAVVNYAKGYERFDDAQVLFLEDGYDEPDFISSDREFHILD